MIIAKKPKQDSEIIKELELEIQRLKEGRFTEEEFQNLCHTFTTEDAERFCNGCEEYQKLLFGYSPITELKCQK